MNHLNKLFSISILILLPLTIWAQKRVVTNLYRTDNLYFEIQDESNVLITFNLHTLKPIDLGMWCTKDNKQTWIFCKSISGDIEKQTFGEKTISWNFLTDGVTEEDLLENKLIFRIQPVEPYAVQRAIEEKKLAKQKAKEERAIARQIRKEESILANENVDGHYFGLGSSVMTPGYYGDVMGLSYEYRYRIYAPNISVGYGKKNLWVNLDAFNANVGIKLYLSHLKRGVRDFYFNLLPFCYFGQDEEHTIKYVLGNNHNIIQIDDYKYSHLWGMGAFFGYSPVWHVNKKIALGFNVDIGVKANYKFNKWRPINWDVGFVIKFKP